MQSKVVNSFTNKPFTDWTTKFSVFLAPGALSFAKQYDCGLSNLIAGLTIEFGDNQSETQYQRALDEYMSGASAGDCLCCLRISEIFAWKNNPFHMKVDSSTSWLYAILAMFYSLCSPFGYEEEIREIFIDYLNSNSDDLSLRKSIELIKQSNDPIAKRHCSIISSTLPLFFDPVLTYKDKCEKFKKYVYALSDTIDEFIIGSFLINIYSGDPEADNSIFESDLVIGYFNSQIIQLFAFHNATFTVVNDAHGRMIYGFAESVWHYLIWKGKHYEGEIDDCLKELLRMCKFILNPKNKISVPYPFYCLLIVILSWCYRKGIFLKKDLSKAHAYLSKLDDGRTPANLLFDKAKVKEKLGLTSEARHIYQGIYQTYQELRHKGEEKTFSPFEYFLMGFIDEKINKNLKRAKEFYSRGSTLVKLPTIKVFESMAFQRKCGIKFEKLEEDS